MWNYSFISVVFIFLFTLYSANTFNVEELKWINYEVDISVTPVKREEVSHPAVHITSRNGQEFQCILPQLNEEEITEKEVVNEKDVDVLELLKPMKSGSCLSKTKDWWTYEFCFGHYIKQFHVEDGEIIGEVHTLGLYESDADWNNETVDQERFKHTKQKYHSQYYTNGSKCDITRQPRNAEVRIFCEEDAFDYIYRVDEPGSCSYIITVHTSRLCSHPLLKPLPSNKAHPIKCHPLLNEDQYSNYLQKLKEEKAIAEEKRSQWLTNQQERLQVLKNENLMPVDGTNEKIPSSSKETLKSVDKNFENIQDILLEEYEKGKTKKVPSSSSETLKSVEKKYEKIREFLSEEYEREMERLKSSLSPEKFAAVRNDVQKRFEKILDEAIEDVELSDEAKDVSLAKLTSVFNMILLEKLDKAAKNLKPKSTVPEVHTLENDPEDKSQSGNQKKGTSQNDDDDDSDEDALKHTSNEQSQTAILEDDKLQVRIRRLDRKSSDSSGKLHEMDFEQRKKLEQAVKEKLEKAGIETLGRRIEVKIITTGYYDNEDGKEFQSLTDEETDQFQNMIMALLTGQQEAVQEMKRHKKLEENYKFTWDENDELDNKDD